MHKDGDAYKKCLKTLLKMVENIYFDANEEKYRRLKKSNKALNEKIFAHETLVFILELIGFYEADIQGELVYVMPGENVNKKQLKQLIQELDKWLDPEAALKDLKEKAKGRIDKSGQVKVGSTVNKKVRDMENDRVNKTSIMSKIYHERKQREEEKAD